MSERISETERIEREALEWFVRLRDDEVGAAERAGFESWIAEDPAHGRAWARVEDLWSALDRVDVGRFRRPRRSRPRPGPSWRVAAAVLVALAVGASVPMLRPDLFPDHETAIGERRTIALEDGSSVVLNTASALSVDYDAGARRTVLHRGEAFFEVAAAPDRPFVVEAAGGEIEALGTAFNVRIAGDATTVSVTGHAVRVTAPTKETRRVEERHAVRYGPRGLDELQPVAPGVDAWTRGRLVFREERLGDVIAELARYREDRLVVGDPRVERIPVTGVFRTDRIDEALATIGRTLPVVVTRDDEGTVTVSSVSPR